MDDWEMADDIPVPVPVPAAAAAAAPAAEAKAAAAPAKQKSTESKEVCRFNFGLWSFICLILVDRCRDPCRLQCVDVRNYHLILNLCSL